MLLQRRAKAQQEIKMDQSKDCNYFQFKCSPSRICLVTLSIFVPYFPLDEQSISKFKDGLTKPQLFNLVINKLWLRYLKALSQTVSKSKKTFLSWSHHILMTLVSCQYHFCVISYEKPEKSLFVWTIDLQKLRKTPSGIFSLPGDLAEQSTKNLLYFCPTGLY